MFDFTFDSTALTQLTAVFIFLIYGVVNAVVTAKVLQYKGYEDTPGWTIAALFFGVFVLIGAAGLPLAKDATIPSRDTDENLSSRD
ncbi:MAG: hypothetical protein GF372_07990 [Candidatus Marinimicrobia bacterium]|nr:hypothetical protein [Candidatus Neomarinimicrobiota bacterium]